MLTFKTWAVQFINDDDYVGFIARVVLRDNEFPDTDDARIANLYINRAQHFEGLAPAFNETWKKYQSDVSSEEKKKKDKS